jgi:DNA-binding IclR family transcriptional regulator
VRREVGSSAWCALEVLATCPRHASDGAWLVRCSVRDLADRLGVATNTAQRALATLRKAALVSPIQGRGDGGRFGSGWYHLTIPPDVLSSQMATDVCAHVGPARVKAVIGEQLELLPSP